MITPTTVYFVLAPTVNLVKIGHARTLSTRLGAYECHSPVPVELWFAFDGTTEHERLLHAHLAIHRSRGEWFHVTDDLRALVERLSASTRVDGLRIIEELTPTGAHYDKNIDQRRREKARATWARKRSEAAQ